LTIESLVTVVREKHRPLMNVDGSSSILMNAGAGAESDRCDIGNGPIGCTADDNIPTTLGRSRLDPVDIIAIDRDPTEANTAPNDQL
jgi:hypothetical protein